MFQPGHSLPGPCTRSGMSTSEKACILGSKAVASYTDSSVDLWASALPADSKGRERLEPDPREDSSSSMTADLTPDRAARATEQKRRSASHTVHSSPPSTPLPTKVDSGLYTLRKAVVSVHVKICPCTETEHTDYIGLFSHKNPFRNHSR